MSHWRHRPSKPNEQVYETPPYTTEIIEVEFDTTEAKRQLAHANQQLALTRQYPGRPRVSQTT
jgi:hypothetical protein